MYRIARFILILLLTIIVVSSTILLLLITKDLPQLPNDLNQLTAFSPTEFYDRNGKRLSSLDGRIPVRLDEISPNFIKAILAVEDKNFFIHAGIDKTAILRAAVNMLFLNKRVQGGSTITQQLVKNLFFSFERTLTRKIREMLLALQIENSFSKEQILESYCNSVYFGLGAYGVEAAAQTYFSKHAKDLTLAEAALLAGLPNAPSRLNPFRNYDAAEERMIYILNEMVSAKFISENEAQTALSDSIRLTPNYPAATGAAYFQDYVMDRLETIISTDLLYAGGLRIYTTLDLQAQFIAQTVLRNHLMRLDSLVIKPKEIQYSPDAPLQGAVVILSSKTNEILALVGGRNYQESQFNRATSANRPPGSAFKPFVYYTAMFQNGLLPDHPVIDAEISVTVDDTVWTPQNYDGKFHGEVPLKKALQLSLNTVAVSLILSTSPESVVVNAKRAGIKSTLLPTYSLSLGATAVSPLELAGAYGTICRLGEQRDVNGILKIIDQDGQEIYRASSKSQIVWSPQVTYMLRDMMRGVVDGGTGYTIRKAGFYGPVAGKTGTTNDNRDVWFVGFSPDYIVAVWVGYDDNRQLIGRNRKGWTGGEICGPIFADIMKELYKDKKPSSFNELSGFQTIKIPPSENDTDSLSILVPIDSLKTKN
ncbi:MAG: PBP1A family penicillin-binding protein [bacterium]|nr:PBP1A family penicillin-binding protein [bacterium]